MPLRPLRDELEDLLSAVPVDRAPHCMRYANGCQCPECRRRARRGARARVQSDETALIAFSLSIGVPLQRHVARATLSQYRTVEAARQAITAMKQAKLRAA